MRFKSTRGLSKCISFEEATLVGLADDGGLYVPEEFPVVNIRDMINDSFQEVFFKILSAFISPSEVPPADLRVLIEKSFSSFRKKSVVDLMKIDQKFYLLELFHGPTFAFKDVALQFLGNLFEYFLLRRERSGKEGITHTTIVGATSGDTGSAAIYGLRGKKNVQVFILHPHGRVSPIQERQMTTVLDDNIHNLAVKGTFDDCQAIVKGLFNDLSFKHSYSLGAVNSINLVRILSQITYYFYSYILLFKQENPQVTSVPHNFVFPKVNFSVPTGNSGDIVAGFYAKMMGLPVDRLFLCTNMNNTLHNFLTNGEYRRSNQVFKTLSPSMDIQVSSNIERFIYFILNGDGNTLREWMQTFENTGRLKVSELFLQKAHEHFLSSDVEEGETLSIIKELIRDHNVSVCPHTAVGIAGARKILKKETKLNLSNLPLICLATAHPAKFIDAVQDALKKNNFQFSFQVPDELKQLFDKPTRLDVVEGSLHAVRETITKKNKFNNHSKL